MFQVNWHELLYEQAPQKRAHSDMSEHASTQAASENPFAPNAIIMTTEDIFTQQHGRPVLLVKKHQKISEEMLNKLIRYGAKPHQFEIQERVIPELSQAQQYRAPQKNIRNPIPVYSQQTPFSASNANDKVLPVGGKLIIADAQEKSLKQTLDVLSHHGISMNQIFSVRQVEHLLTAIERFDVSLLMIDASFYPLATIFPFLRQLETMKPLAQVIITVNPHQIEDANLTLLFERAERNGVHVLCKPMTAYGLAPYLKPFKVQGRFQDKSTL